jgi:hypothetical protein
VDGRAHVLNNEATFERLVAFLLDSPTRYHWFGRRFVMMPDHIHLIAHQGHDAIRLGQWIKALKAVVGGLERNKATPDAASGDAAYDAPRPADVGRVPSHGESGELPKGWRRVVVKEMADSIQYGHTASAVQRDDGPRFLRMSA